MILFLLEVTWRPYLERGESGYAMPGQRSGRSSLSSRLRGELVAPPCRSCAPIFCVETSPYLHSVLVTLFSHDRAGTMLLLGCQDGSINYVDLEKFPVRMKDNDLLVNKLYNDPDKEAITAMSFYLTPSATSDQCLEVCGLSRDAPMNACH